MGTHDCIIVITSDKGLAGSLNSAVLKEATLTIKMSATDLLSLFVLERKRMNTSLRRGYDIPKHYVTCTRRYEAISDMEEVVTLVTKFRAKEYTLVYVVYQSLFLHLSRRPSSDKFFHFKKKKYVQ
jgi:F-type H+-transporting ATPase subunit gamma